MKKVLFVATVSSHINAFHIPYLKMFKENGYEVHVACKEDEKVIDCDKQFNINFERFPLKRGNIKAYKELKKIIDENDYEIIHCHTPVGGALTRLAARKTRKNGTRVIYTAHGFHFYKGAPIKNWLIFYPIEKILSKYTDTLITINTEDYELAKKKFKKCKDIQYVHGVGLDTSRFDIEYNEEDLQALRSEIGIKKDDIVLTYVAELNANKNQILLIKTLEELIKQNDHYKLVLVGDGNKRKEYEDYVKKHNLEKNVRILGRRQDVPFILKITDIYVASSIREGLPVNIMEALYMNLPVVATDNRGHRDLIVKNNLLLDNTNIKEFANKINNISYNGKKKNQEILKYILFEVIEKMNVIYNKL